MTFKVSRKGKPGEAEGSYKKGQRSYPDFDTISDAYPLPPGSTSSTPAWDFPSQVVLEDEEGPKQWTAQVEPGVQITFVSLPHGGNDLKRIRFRYLLSESLLPTLHSDYKFIVYYVFEAGRCSTSGKHRDGGVRIMIG